MKHRQRLRAIVLVSGCVALLSSVASAENLTSVAKGVQEKLDRKGIVFSSHTYFGSRGAPIDTVPMFGVSFSFDSSGINLGRGRMRGGGGSGGGGRIQWFIEQDLR